jgi:hypothetical protein
MLYVCVCPCERWAVKHEDTQMQYRSCLSIRNGSDSSYCGSVPTHVTSHFQLCSLTRDFHSINTHTHTHTHTTGQVGQTPQFTNRVTTNSFFLSCSVTCRSPPRPFYNGQRKIAFLFRNEHNGSPLESLANMCDNRAVGHSYCYTPEKSV